MFEKHVSLPAFSGNSGCIVGGWKDSMLDYDAEAAAHTGLLRAELARLGPPIGPYDQMIAGHARANGLIVVTNNRREFERIPGLRIEDWVSPMK